MRKFMTKLMPVVCYAGLVTTAAVLGGPVAGLLSLASLAWFLS